MNLTLVIPLLNEQESLPELHHWIVKVMQAHNFTYEILFIDDGSTDASWQTISKLSNENPNVKGIRFLRNYGKSQALHAGFAKAQGDVIITMDADLQDSPDEIPELFRLITEDNYDLVSGWKKKRYDSVVAKNIPSKLFNWAARKTSGVTLNDFNCGLKAYKNIVVKNIEVSGEMHRYIPVLAKNAGFSKIGEKIVIHQARKYGNSKFGMSRFINGFLDLITIWFLSTFGKRPMHLLDFWVRSCLSLDFYLHFI
jgi:glycosyltransferase involved in cell wall biosynthesis